MSFKANQWSEEGLQWLHSFSMHLYIEKSNSIMLDQTFIDIVAIIIDG